MVSRKNIPSQPIRFNCFVRTYNPPGVSTNSKLNQFLLFMREALYISMQGTSTIPSFGGFLTHLKHIPEIIQCMYECN